MNIFISTLFPNLYDQFLLTSIIGKAIDKNILSIKLINMFSLVSPKERIDSPTVGHGAGMLLGVNITEKVYNYVVEKNSENKTPFVIFFSPHGKMLNQYVIKDIKNKIQDRDLLLFAGRYEGFDARAEEEYADEIISIGNYVLFGGDLPIMLFIESLVRLIPGIVNSQSSIECDSFSSSLVDYPHYALPTTWKNKEIPAILKSGNHKDIQNWRDEKATKRTVLGHWEWLSKHNLSVQEKKKVKKHIPNHYCVLLHNDVIMPNGLSGESIVTSIDIHDIARSATTYGICQYFIVTRLESQKKLIENFLTFWHQDEVKKINQSRAFALDKVFIKSEIEEVITSITEKEGIAPITIVTSSRRNVPHKAMISFHDQNKIWEKNRPIVFILGTAHGINEKIINNFDYKLVPIEGLEDFNFLSVRSAAAIIFDRWLGFNCCY